MVTSALGRVLRCYYYGLPWRNLWRQKRRTLLTATALALVLFLSLLTRAFQEGSYSSNIKNAAKFYTGLIQLQNPEFGDSSSIDDVLPQTDAFISASKANSDIDVILPRVESFALAAKGERSKGVMGPSGSGKTTLLNMLGGIDAPTSGSVEIDGCLISDMSEKELIAYRRDNIGFIFQDYSLLPVLTALENVEFVMQLQGKTERECRERAMHHHY